MRVFWRAPKSRRRAKKFWRDVQAGRKCFKYVEEKMHVPVDVGLGVWKEAK